MICFDLQYALKKDLRSDFIVLMVLKKTTLNMLNLKNLNTHIDSVL